MGLSDQLAAVFTAAVRACDPAAVVAAALTARPVAGPVTVVAIGKAAVAMARGAVAALGPAPAVVGALRPALVAADVLGHPGVGHPGHLDA